MKTNLLTPCSRVLTEKLRGPQPLKKFLAFYGNRMFITAFTNSRLLSLSSARSIQSILLFRLYRKISLVTRLLCLVCNKVKVKEELLAPRPTPKVEDYPLSAVRNCLFNIFAATLHICRPFLHPQPEDAPCRGDSGYTFQRL